jgi:tetratricopeptide (TPR) repeat protein
MPTSRVIASYLAMVLSVAPVCVYAQVPQPSDPGSASSGGILSVTSPSPARPTPAPAPGTGGGLSVATPAPTRGGLSVALASPAAAAGLRFWDIGYELAQAPNITGPEADQAIILLTAAKSLNSQIVGAEPLLLRLASRYSQKDYSDPITFWLQRYVGPSADRVVVEEAVRRLVSWANSPDERQKILEKVALKIKNKSAAVDSDLATALGLLMLEKGMPDQAKFYLVQAYNNNKFNRLAFAKLAEVAPNEVGPAATLEHLRMMVRENPLDLEAALRFAGYAERLGLYDIAAQSYQYCAEVFRYLYPSDELPQHIYLPWAISCYNTSQGLEVCTEIAKTIRGLNRFDILLEAFAGKAALKLGRPAEARQIFEQAEQKARQLLESGQTPPASGLAIADTASAASAKQLAWFYSFADLNPEKALDWANKAYSAEPNSPAAGALLAYALVMNNRLELAKPLFAPQGQSQVADLVAAYVQLAAGNKPEAIQTLKNTVARDGGSLTAERGKQMLRDLGSTYVPPIDPRALAGFLARGLGKAYVPRFLPPAEMVEIKFSTRGTSFSYGDEIEGIVTLVNKASEPLIISDYSLFQGNIRVSAQVSGDLKRDIPNVAFETIRTDLAVLPGRSVVHTLRLSTGELRDLLLAYPQAELQIQFTLYLDPVVTETGAVCNRLVDIKPVTALVARPRAAITADAVRTRSNSLASAPGAQRIQTALLFTGLLKEQEMMREQGTLYAFQYADWLPAQLRQSLTSPTGLLMGGGEGEWVARVNAVSDLLGLSLDQELATVVARRLTDPQWPVRLMAVYVLARSSTSNFNAVLDWVAKNDKDELVRSMAVSLLSASASALTPSLPAGYVPATRP